MTHSLALKESANFRRRLRDARLLGGVGCCVVALWLTACGGLVVQRVDQVRAPGGAEPFAHGSFAQWKADSDRLIDDIPRAVERCHWGLERIEPADWLAWRAVAADPAARVIHAKARTPNDRTVHIVAWPVGADEVAVAVRVDPFGDAQVQAKFLETLARVLAGKAKPRRGGRFELPE